MPAKSSARVAQLSGESVDGTRPSAALHSTTEQPGRGHSHAFDQPSNKNSSIPVIVIPDSPPRPSRPAKTKRRNVNPTARWPTRSEHLLESDCGSCQVHRAQRRTHAVRWQKLAGSQAELTRESAQDNFNEWLASGCSYKLCTWGETSVACLDQQTTRSTRREIRRAVERPVKNKRSRNDLDGFIASEEDDFDDLRNSAFGNGLHEGKDADSDDKVWLGRLSNVILLAGPTASAKTSVVFAVAEELGWNVVEINPGTGRRSAKDIDRLVGDLGRNHTVKALQTASLFKRPDASSSATSPGPTCSEHSQPEDRSLILFEEVDILFEDERDFWLGLANLAKASMRPIVLTCNDLARISWTEVALQPIYSGDGQEQFYLPFERPDVISAATIIQAAMAAEVRVGAPVERGCQSEAPTSLLAKYEQQNSDLDLRQTLMQLQFESLVSSSANMNALSKTTVARRGSDLSVFDELRATRDRVVTGSLHIGESDEVLGTVALQEVELRTLPDIMKEWPLCDIESVADPSVTGSRLYARDASDVVAAVAPSKRKRSNAEIAEYISFLRDITLADDFQSTRAHNDSLGGTASHGIRRSRRLAGTTYIRRIEWLQQHDTLND
ncbi:hypothetical protein OIO90_001407 [Microbotryomycetes sp. JL221]|nr:hypothetical protein OIO90_001407 [Microbotryomycetes sp. JL221]